MLRNSCVFALLLFLVSLSAQAQEPTFDPSLTEDCVAATTDTLEKEGCVGRSATQCMLDTPDGLSTEGMTACYAIELDYWQERLDKSHDSLLDRLTQWDEQKDADNLSEVSLMVEMQEAWTAHRDASCAFLLSRSGEVGDGAAFVTVTCRTGHTAQQAMFLENLDRNL